MSDDDPLRRWERELDEKRAPRASTTRRQWWWVLRASAGLPLLVVGTYNVVHGDINLAAVQIAFGICCGIWPSTGIWLYRMGYSRGSIQTLIDHTEMVSLRTYLERRDPHPADPTPPAPKRG